MSWEPVALLVTQRLGLSPGFGELVLEAIATRALTPMTDLQMVSPIPSMENAEYLARLD